MANVKIKIIPSSLLPSKRPKFFSSSFPFLCLFILEYFSLSTNLSSHQPGKSEGFSAWYNKQYLKANVKGTSVKATSFDLHHCQIRLVICRLFIKNHKIRHSSRVQLADSYKLM